MKLFNTLAALCLTGFSTCSPALAEDNSLYAEAAPSDASFVRFIGYKDAKEAQFSGHTFALPSDADGKYIPVSSALLKNVASGSYVSVLRAADGTQDIITERARTRQSKVAVLLINATEKQLELRLADGSTPVIENVAPASAGQREVNPVAIALGVFEVGARIPVATFDVALRRGQNISFVADHTGIRLIENQFTSATK